MPEMTPALPEIVESPPPSARSEARDDDDPRVELNRLADALASRHNTRFLIEYLRLRRLLRS